MALPRFIPKHVFQVIALAVLIGALTIAVQLIVQRSATFRWLADVTGSRILGGVVLILLAAFDAALLIGLLRRLARVPTLREEMDALELHSVGDLVAHAKAHLAANLQSRRRIDVGEAGVLERRTYYGMMVIGCVIVAIVTGLATISNYELDADHVLVAPPVFAFAAIVALPYYLVHWLRARAAQPIPTARVRTPPR